jgi:cytochrome b561
MKLVDKLLTFFLCSFLSNTSAISQKDIQSLAARALQQQTDWDEGSWSGTWQNPEAQDPFAVAQLGGFITGSILAFRVNPGDSRADGADTITIVYQVPTLAWAAIGFSNNGGNMIGSEAVIALPETNQVLKYSLGGKSVDAVQPMPDEQQTLIEAGMIQDDGVTTMAFTKIMSEAGEVPIVVGLNTWLGAWGSSSTLAYHSARQPFNINIDIENLDLETISPGEGVVATEAPDETEAPVGTVAPDETEAPASAEGEEFTVRLGGLVDGSVLQFTVNKEDARTGGQDTITVVYTVPTAAWAGIAFSGNGGFMIGSEAVIGLPDAETVLKYNLNAQNPDGVVPFDEAQQTLIETSVIQDDVSTVLTFTKILAEDGEIPIAIGENTFLGAWGISNDLGFHSARQPFNIDLTNGALTIINPGEGVAVGETDPPQETQSPQETTPPQQSQPPEVVVDANGFTAVPLQGQLDGAVLEFVVNNADPNAGTQDSVTFKYTIPTASWAGIAFSDNGGFMIGSEAVIGLPDAKTVLKYQLNAKSNDGVVPFSDAQQTLIDTSIIQESDTTTLTFTKIMVEDGEIPIVLGANTLLGAWGSGNDLAFHAARQSFSLDLLGGAVEQNDVRKQSYWKAHGFIAGIAWGLLCPLAIAASVLRKLFNGSLWFEIHRALNTMVVLATIIAFSLAVAAINQETPEGVSPQHFNPRPYPHRLVGLFIFIIAIVQALLGFFRPHVPEEGEKKSSVRFVWEIVHRCLGFICLGMAIYQVQSGIKIYLSIFDSSANYLLVIFWTVAAAIIGATALGFGAIKFSNVGNTEPMPAKKEDNKDFDDGTGREKEQP